MGVQAGEVQGISSCFLTQQRSPAAEGHAPGSCSAASLLPAPPPPSSCWKFGNPPALLRHRGLKSPTAKSCCELDGEGSPAWLASFCQRSLLCFLFSAADTSVWSHPSHSFSPHPKPHQIALLQKAQHNFAHNFPSRFCLCPPPIKMEIKPKTSLAEGQQTGY